METLKAVLEGGDTQTLTAAIAYTRREWYVFPTKTGTKYPATPHGVKDATLDPDLINEWFGAGNPNQYGIAIACGVPSGIAVVDVDVKSGGLDSLDRLTGGVPLSTPTARTPNGGLHLFFEYPADVIVNNSVSRVAPGIDIRSTNGYVVAAPTVLEAGQYKWEITASTVKPAAFPLWAMSADEKPKAYEVKAVVREGEGRNNYLTSWAGRLRSDGVDDPVFMLALLNAINETRCSPPLEAEIIESLAKRSVNWQPTEGIKIRPPQPKWRNVNGTLVKG